MSTRTLTFTAKRAGALVDVTSVTLGSSGLVRADTAAVVVAGGTALTRASLGTYTLTFTEPGLFLKYTYELIIENNGESYSFPGVLHPLPSALPSYLTVEEANVFAQATYGLADYNNASDTLRTQALATATSRIDSMTWQGAKFVRTQVLEFPRADLRLDRVDYSRTYPSPGQVPNHVYDWDDVTQSAVVPLNVKLACVIEANSIINGARANALAKAERGLTSDKIGSAAETYDFSAILSTTAEPLCQRALELLAKYRLRSGGLL